MKKPTKDNLRKRTYSLAVLVLSFPMASLAHTEANTSITAVVETRLDSMISNAGFEWEICIFQNIITMAGIRGTVWKTLSFTLPQKSAALVNRNGVVGANENTVKETELDSDNFLIQIRHTDKGLELKGIQGTKWQEINCHFGSATVWKISQSGLNR